MPPATAHPYRLPMLVFLAGLVVCGLYIAWQRADRAEIFGEESAIACHLAAGHGFLSPGDPSPTASPTSWSPPIYPMLMAGVYKVVGTETRHAQLVLLAIQSLSFAAAVAGLAVLGRRLFCARVGAIAAGLLLLQPMFLAYLSFYWDHFPTLAAFLWLLVAADMLARRAPAPLLAGLFGAGLAGLALLNTSYFLAYPLLFLLILRCPPTSSRTISAGACVLGFVLVLTPWTIRNYHAFGEIFFVRRLSSIEVYIGNVPGSNGLSTSAMPHHPLVNPQEKQLLLEMGEVRYADFCRDRFSQELHADPGGFVSRSIKRAFYLPLGDPRESMRTPPLPLVKVRGYALGPLALAGAMLILAGVGAVRAWRKNRLAIWPLLVGLLAVLPYTFTHVQDRYAFPLRAILYLYAAIPLAGWWEQRSKAEETPA